jgi:AAA+ superfamily predicted ATPase
MILTTTQDNSEHALMSELYKMADAGASVLQVRTREVMRGAMTLRRNILLSEHSEYREWDAINGFRSFTREDYVSHIKAGDQKDFMSALEEPLGELRNTSSSINSKRDTVHYYIFVDPHPYLANNPVATELVQQYAAMLPSTNVCIIFVTPDVTLDGITAGTLLISDMSTPSAEELQDVLVKIIEKAEGDFKDGSELSDEDIRRLSVLGLGLSLYEFETYAAIAIIDANQKDHDAITFEVMSDGIALGKTAVVKQSDILELMAGANMADVGGMNRLKDWVASRADCYSDEAKAFGIEPPKGAVVVGVPGGGKSLVARATASELGVPLVRMDFSRIFSKYIGDSESRIRSALKMVEQMAPCVLFLDELDKGLGGSANGGGDSGTSSRVLGSFLSWLQDNTAPVFVMVTANRVDGLPPELLRRGRFDQIFSVGLPTDKERLEVLDIHLRKRNKTTTFSKEDLFEFTAASRDYVPAEIESSVKDALIMAFNEKTTVKMAHILRSLKDMVPMSKSNADAIAKIVAWARDNATPVNYDATTDAPLVNLGLTRRVATNRTRPTR